MLQEDAKTETEGAWGLANLRLIGTAGYLDRNAFLAMLNGRRPKWLPHSKIVRRGLHLRKTLQSRDIDSSAQLRLYIDEWLDTGLTKDGAEAPRARDLTKAFEAHAAISRCVGKLPMQFELRRDGLVLRLPIWFGKLPLEMDTPLETADKLCALFFLCDWRSKLAKCRRAGCGRYFELKHWNRTYSRLIACPGCARTRSAVLSTSNARKEAEMEVYRLVAKRFRKQVAKSVAWHQDQKLRARIIRFINARIADGDTLRRVYRHSLTGKWLSRSKNRIGIEEIVKGEIHAQS